MNLWEYQSKFEFLYTLKKLPYYLHLVVPKTLLTFKIHFKAACTKEKKAIKEFQAMFNAAKNIHGTKSDEIRNHSERLEQVFMVKHSEKQRKSSSEISQELKLVAETVPTGLTSDEREIIFLRWENTAERNLMGAELEQIIKYIKAQQTAAYSYLPSTTRSHAGSARTTSTDRSR